MLIPELLVIEAVMVTLQVEQQPTGPRFKSHLKPMLSKEIFIPIRKIFIDKNIFAEKRDCCGRIKKRCGKFRKKPDPETVPNNPEHLHNLRRINKPNFFGIDVSAEAASLQLAEAYLVWLKFVECLWSKMLTYSGIMPWQDLSRCKCWKQVIWYFPPDFAYLSLFITGQHS